MQTDCPLQTARAKRGSPCAEVKTCPMSSAPGLSSCWPHVREAPAAQGPLHVTSHSPPGEVTGAAGFKNPVHPACLHGLSRDMRDPSLSRKRGLVSDFLRKDLPEQGYLERNQPCFLQTNFLFC